MEIEKITIENKEYPIRLKNIKNPPKQIYVIGNKKILNQKGIAIVGSRNCTKKGAENAKLFGANIALEGLTVISGLAKGIDAAAHTRSIRSKAGKR